MADTRVPDDKLLDALESYIKKRGFVMLHNLTGRDDPNWPQGWNGGGIGLIPWAPRSLRDAIQSCCVVPAEHLGTHAQKEGE